MSEAAAAALATGALHLRAGKMFQLAAFVMMNYDHLITFADEVQYVWKQPLSGATVLFVINRYVTPLKFIVELVAFNSPAWSKNLLIFFHAFSWACEHFVRFEGGGTLALIAIGEIIMMLRVYAIWERDKRILALLGFFWVVQVAFCTLALVFSQRVPLPPVLVGCILTGSITHGNFFTPFWIMPLITDSAVFFLTLWRTQKYSRRYGNMPLLQVLQRDGALYFLCIFSANLLNVVLYLSATEDLKAIGAGFSQIITCVMISRLVINLRSLRTNIHIPIGGPLTPPSPYAKSTTTQTYQKKTFIDTIIWNLAEGSDVDSFATRDDKPLKMQPL